MKIQRRHFLRLGAGAVAMPALSRLSFAQAAWPNRVIRLVVGFPPGGGADSSARIVAARLSEVWGQQVVIENKPGAGGNIAHDTAAHAAPDGYTMLFSPGSFPIMPLLFNRLNYDPIADFAPVSFLGTYPNLIVVPKEFGLEHTAGLHRQGEGQSRQGDLRVAGHRHHAAARRRTVQEHGQDRRHPRALSRRGGGRHAGPARQPRRLHVQHHRLAACIGARRPDARAGGLDAEALRADAGYSDLRGIRRAGLRRGVVVRAVCAGQDAARYRDEDARRRRKVLAEPAIKTKYEALGVVAESSTPEQLAATMQAEIKLWGPVIKSANLKAE